MLSDLKEVKRYAIYVFYDSDGIVDEYNLYMLQKLKPHISFLQIICNGEIDEEGEKHLCMVADDFVKRENEGFDITAYKRGIIEAGIKELEKYDEIVLLNSTFFGPLYPFEEMFTEMNQRELDFWGITSFSKTTFDPFGTIEYGFIPTHIQSFFIVLRKSLHQTKDFWDYWESIPTIHSYEEAVGCFEAVFTEKMAEKGFEWGTYVECPELEKYTFSPLNDFPRYVIEEKRCPILKRRFFFHEYRDLFSRSTGDEVLDAYRFIEEKLDYDTDMIWANILRLQNLADIKKKMHLNYVLPNKFCLSEKTSTMRIALILHIYYKDMSGECLKYIRSMPDNADIYITVPSEDKKNYIQQEFSGLPCRKLEVSVVENRGRDVSALLVGSKGVVLDGKYDLVCFLHDKKVIQSTPGSIGQSWGYQCFENLLGSKEYVKNIIDTFCENPRLGILCPPPPLHSVYYPTLGCLEWGDNYVNTKKMAKKLKLKIDIDRKKEPVTPIGSFFWFRPEALKTLFEYQWQYEDFSAEPLDVDGTISHAIERIHPFVAQSNGYYSAYTLHEEFAKIHFTNLEFTNDTLKTALMERYGSLPHLELMESVRREREK